MFVKKPNILMKYTLFILAASVLSVSAATVVDVSSSGGGARGTLVLGQTFTTGTLGTETQLQSVSIATSSDGASGAVAGPFYVEIWTDADSDATTYGLGTRVAVSNSTVNLATASSSDSASFSSGILADNTVYTLILSTDGLGTPANARVGLNGPTTNGVLGSNGTLFANGASTYGDQYELAFNVATTTPVPEASASLFIGLAGASLLLRRRR